MITDYKTYEEAKAKFTWDQVWDFFDGNRDHREIFASSSIYTPVYISSTWIILNPFGGPRS